MKKLVSVNSKHDHAVLAINFTLQILSGQGVTVFAAGADCEPAAAVMVIGFPHQTVAQRGILHPGDQGYLTVPGVVGHLLDFQVFGFKSVLTVEIYVEECIVFNRIDILLRFAERAHGVRRTTETGNVMLAVLRPAHHVGELLRATQSLGIEIVLTVERDAGENAIIEFGLDVVEVFAIACSLEHTPREQQHTDLGTDLIVCGLLRQLELPTIGLVDLLD